MDLLIVTQVALSLTLDRLGFAKSPGMLVVCVTINRQANASIEEETSKTQFRFSDDQ